MKIHTKQMIGCEKCGQYLNTSVRTWTVILIHQMKQSDAFDDKKLIMFVDTIIPNIFVTLKEFYHLPSSRFINNKRTEKVMNHYVYYSYEDWGRGYIGVRQCECNIYEDEYFGSYYDKSFNPTNKIILTECNTREEALAAEVILHNFYDVKNNPHFVNQANQTSSKFDYDNSGIPMSEETRKKISEAKKGHLKGKKQSPEQIAKRIESRKNGGGWSKETGKKVSQSLKGNIPWNKGKKVGPMSEEQKEKIKNTMKEKVKFRQRNDDGTFTSS